MSEVVNRRLFTAEVLVRSLAILDPWPFSVVYVVEEVTLGQVCLRVPRSLCNSIIPSALHVHLHLQVTLTKRTNGRSLRPFQRSVLLRQRGSIRWKSIFSPSQFNPSSQCPRQPLDKEDSNSP